MRKLCSVRGGTRRNCSEAMAIRAFAAGTLAAVLGPCGSCSLRLGYYCYPPCVVLNVR
jgi:hypothetical protein